MQLHNCNRLPCVQDLAKGLALLCVVFNCGEGLDYKAMGSIFSGLVQCGAWGCFDEFNRIEAEVLSVVSSQIKQIQEALKNDLTRFLFEGREISIDNRTGGPPPDCVVCLPSTAENSKSSIATYQ